METWRDELYHHGILGQKWGVRRYQNPDGSLTPEGRKHYSRYGRVMASYQSMFSSDSKTFSKASLTGAKNAVQSSKRSNAAKRGEFDEGVQKMVDEAQRNTIKKTLSKAEFETKRFTKEYFDEKGNVSHRRTGPEEYTMKEGQDKLYKKLNKQLRETRYASEIADKWHGRYPNSMENPKEYKEFQKDCANAAKELLNSDDKLLTKYVGEALSYVRDDAYTEKAQRAIRKVTG